MGQTQEGGVVPQVAPMANIPLLEEKTMQVMHNYDSDAEKAVEILTEILKMEPNWVPGLLLLRGLYYRCPRMVPNEFVPRAVQGIAKLIAESIKPPINPSVMFLEQLVRDLPAGKLLPLSAAYLAGSWRFFGARDIPGATWFFQAAAKQNQVDAIVCLGDFYLNGQGVPKDFQKGIQLINNAAERGHSGAQCTMAVATMERNRPTAMRYLRLSADNGNIPAQLRLAQYLFSQSNPKEREEGLAYIQRAAATGDQAALTLLHQAQSILAQQTQQAPTDPGCQTNNV